MNCILKKGKAFNLGFRGSNSLVFLNKKIIIVYKRWENNGTKTYRVSGFCFKIKKKKFETLLLLKSKDKKIIIVYKRWENNGTKTYRVSGFCFKIKKKKFETLLLLKSKDKSAEVTMGFILESPNLVRINII